MKPLLSLAFLLVPLALSAATPNIVLIMTDDQGYGDLACHGNPHIKTPNLDRMHKESVRFTDFHVSPTCAPTRSALLTGRHEFKNGITHTIQERERLTLKATTLPQMLKTVGYTTGIFGKWHLGDEDDYQPGKRGFDEAFIHGAGGIGQTYPGSCGDAPGNKYTNPVIRHNGTFVKTDGYCTDVFFTQASKWIEGQKGKPFFAYITPNAPHAPLDCPPGSDTPYLGKVPPNVAKFYGMIENIDTNVGKLLTKLKDLGIENDTLVIFMTDNGTATGDKVFNAGMRGAKNTPYTGGTRVPAFWRWPGKFPAGVDVPVLTCHWDIVPTLSEITGFKIEGEVAKQAEGRSLMPLLKDPKAKWENRFFISHQGRWPKGKAAENAYSNASVRDERWQLVFTNAKKHELFDLKNDPGEKTDVSAANPNEVARLKAAFDDWWKASLPLMVNEDAVGPSVNPYHAAYWKQFNGPGPNNVAPKK
jgi:arylsulfatase A-like enzyme